jgi:hypothetical protein
VVGKREMLAAVPMVEVWEELQAQMEELAGQARLCNIGAILENEVTRRVGPPHRTKKSSVSSQFAVDSPHQYLRLR